MMQMRNIFANMTTDLHAQAGLERGQAGFRFLFALIFAMYVGGMFAAGYRDEVAQIFPALLAYLLFGISQIASTRIVPAFSFQRCSLAVVLDQVCIAWIMLASGIWGAPFAFTPAVGSIGHGLRHGARFAYFSCAVSAVTVSAVMVLSPFWSAQPAVAVGVVLASVCLPVYAAALSTRLTRDKQQIEQHARDLEAIAVDARERLQQRQTELAHLSRLSTMGEMASGIAHEINQPLSAIVSYNQASIRMLAEPEPDHAELTRAMRMAAEQSKRVGEIIRRLRSFVRNEPPQARLLDLNDVVGASLELIDHLLVDAMVRVNTELAANLPPVAADSIQLEQVLLNLLRNAIDAMQRVPPAARRVTLRTRAAGGGVEIEVVDAGSGIDQATLARLFHPFFTTKADGMGLGLAISQTIVESFGGSIAARNGEQCGAIFTIVFPAGVPAQLARSPEDSHA